MFYRFTLECTMLQVAYENEGVPLILYAFTTTQAQRDDWIEAVKAGMKFTVCKVRLCCQIVDVFM